MKLFRLLAAVAFGAPTKDEYPHDPDVMEYCQGMVGGYYPVPDDCSSYFVCWNYGEYTPITTLPHDLIHFGSPAGRNLRTILVRHGPSHVGTKMEDSKIGRLPSDHWSKSARLVLILVFRLCVGVAMRRCFE